MKNAFASIDGELIAARTGEQRTDSVPAASRRRAGSEHPYLFAWKTSAGVERPPSRRLRCVTPPIWAYPASFP